MSSNKPVGTPFVTATNGRRFPEPALLHGTLDPSAPPLPALSLNEEPVIPFDPQIHNSSIEPDGKKKLPIDETPLNFAAPPSHNPYTRVDAKDEKKQQHRQFLREMPLTVSNDKEDDELNRGFGLLSVRERSNEGEELSVQKSADDLSDEIEESLKYNLDLLFSANKEIEESGVKEDHIEHGVGTEFKQHGSIELCGVKFAPFVNNETSMYLRAIHWDPLTANVICGLFTKQYLRADLIELKSRFANFQVRKEKMRALIEKQIEMTTSKYTAHIPESVFEVLAEADCVSRKLGAKSETMQMSINNTSNSGADVLFIVFAVLLLTESTSKTKNYLKWAFSLLDTWVDTVNMKKSNDEENETVEQYIYRHQLGLLHTPNAYFSNALIQQVYTDLDLWRGTSTTPWWIQTIPVSLLPAVYPDQKNYDRLFIIGDVNRKKTRESQSKYASWSRISLFIKEKGWMLSLYHVFDPLRIGPQIFPLSYIRGYIYELGPFSISTVLPEPIEDVSVDFEIVNVEDSEKMDDNVASLVDFMKSVFSSMNRDKDHYVVTQILEFIEAIRYIKGIRLLVKKTIYFNEKIIEEVAIRLDSKNELRDSDAFGSCNSAILTFCVGPLLAYYNRERSRKRHLDILAEARRKAVIRTKDMHTLKYIYGCIIRTACYEFHPAILTKGGCIDEELLFSTYEAERAVDTKLEILIQKWSAPDDGKIETTEDVLKANVDLERTLCMCNAKNTPKSAAVSVADLSNDHRVMIQEFADAIAAVYKDKSDESAASEEARRILKMFTHSERSMISTMASISSDHAYNQLNYSVTPAKIHVRKHVQPRVAKTEVELNPPIPDELDREVNSWRLTNRAINKLAASMRRKYDEAPPLLPVDKMIILFKNEKKLKYDGVRIKSVLFEMIHNIDLAVHALEKSKDEEHKSSNNRRLWIELVRYLVQLNEIISSIMKTLSFSRRGAEAFTLSIAVKREAQIGDSHEEGHGEEEVPLTKEHKDKEKEKQTEEQKDKPPIKKEKQEEEEEINEFFG
jgi:hypothetical protein